LGNLGNLGNLNLGNLDEGRIKVLQEAKLSLGQPTVLPHSRLSSN